MAVTVKSKDELAVPRAVQRQACIKAGQRVQFKVSGGIISILPNLPPADDEYTPAHDGNRFIRSRHRSFDGRAAERSAGF